MKLLDNIERIPTPDVETFERRYMDAGAPVIFTGFFDAEPIASLSSSEAFRRRFGELGLDVYDEFFPDFLRSGSVKQAKAPERMRRLTFQEYLDFVAREPDARFMVSGQDTPAELADTFSAPEHCRRAYRAEQGLTSHIFLGKAGDTAHLHFDFDLKHVLLYQVFGYKRVTLFPARVGRRLHPILTWSSLCLEMMSDDERYRLMQYGEAWDTVLAPGETIYMPPLVWHHLDYIDTALSVSLRFGRDPDHAFFTGLIPTTFLQNVMDRVLRGGLEDQVRADILRQLRMAHDARYPSAREKFDAVDVLARSLYEQHCQDATQGFFALPPSDVIYRNVEHLAPIYNAYVPSPSTVQCNATP